MASTIVVEVVYALAERQMLQMLEVPVGSSARAVVRAAGLEVHFPELDLSRAPLGMYGKLLSDPDARVLQDGERVEILRPLLADPKEIRKQRAARVARNRG